MIHFTGHDPKNKQEDGNKGQTPDTQPDPHYSDEKVQEATGNPEDQDGKAPEDLDSDEEKW